MPKLIMMLALAFWALTLPVMAEENNGNSGERRIMIAVALSFSEYQGRWERELTVMRYHAAANNFELRVEVARDNQMQQNIQVDRLLSGQPDVLIISPHDAASAASAIKKAKEQGVKVIFYDRLIMNADADLYISFDSELVGRMQAQALLMAAPSGEYILLSGSPADHNTSLLFDGAMNILGPYIDAGRIKVTAWQPIINWDPVWAEAAVEKVLAQGIRPAAILAPNDTTAGGAVEALVKRGLAGRVAVTGQDADQAAARRIAQGLQLMTAFKDTRLLAAKAMESAKKLATGEPLEYSGHINNGSHLVPAILLEPVAVNRSNMVEILIDNGYLLYDHVFDRPTDQPPQPENFN